MKRCLDVCVCLIPSLLFCSPVQGIDIELDYTHDDATDGFFNNTPQAKSALEKAADDVGALISSSLNALGGGPYVGSAGSSPFTTTATFNWRYLYKDPSTKNDVVVNNPTISANTVRIFVGVDELAGNTLGQGGPSGAGFTLSGSGFESNWLAAVADGQTKSNLATSRGGGPTVNTYNSSSTLGGTTANYSLTTGIAIGKLSMDVDTNNDGSMNSAAQLADYWHYDHTTPVAAGKLDFYSVALHEILHSIGFGLAESWDSLTSGNNWLGSHVIAEYGTGANLVDGGHIANNISSPRLSDGTLQEAALTPSISSGERRELTALDAAFLRDIGYTTVPEPSSACLLAVAAGFCFVRCRS